MIPNSSRKQFFAKLLGVVAATGVIPKATAKAPARETTARNSGASGRFELRHDGRAVARREQV